MKEVAQRTSKTAFGNHGTFSLFFAFCVLPCFDFSKGDEGERVLTLDIFLFLMSLNLFCITYKGQKWIEDSKRSQESPHLKTFWQVLFLLISLRFKLDACELSRNLYFKFLWFTWNISNPSDTLALKISEKMN